MGRLKKLVHPKKEEQTPVNKTMMTKGRKVQRESAALTKKERKDFHKKKV